MTRRRFFGVVAGALLAASALLWQRQPRARKPVWTKKKVVFGEGPYRWIVDEIARAPGGVVKVHP